MTDVPFGGWRNSPLYQLTRAKVLEFLREPEAVFWVFLFPLLLALALGVAFRSQPPLALPIGVESGSHAAARVQALEAAERIDARELDAEEALQELRAGRLALVVLEGDPTTYFFDPNRPDSRVARLEVDAILQEAEGREDAFIAQERILEEKGSRYVDFLIPGLLAMNLMGTGMWAIGFYLVQQRSGKLLKLFVAAPMRRWHFLAAQILARLVFLSLEVGVLLAFAVFVLDVPMRGSLLLFGMLATWGAMAFVGLGLLVASRAKTIEGVSGLMNFVMAPMWILSGVFFSASRFPDAMQPVIQILPLTALVDALRDVMLDGAGPVAVAGDALVLTLWTLLSFIAALRLFRWQ